MQPNKNLILYRPEFFDWLDVKGLIFAFEKYCSLENDLSDCLVFQES